MAEAYIKRLFSRMSSTLGHELRQPLAVIKNSAYFVKAKLASLGKSDPKIDKHLGIIEDEIRTADRMISEIHSVSKPVEVRLTAQPVDAAVEKSLSAVELPKGVALKIAFKAGQDKAQIDAEKLGEVLKRLLVNAAEAMPGGGSVTVSTSSDKTGVVLEVSDTGPGIPKEVSTLMFMPFNSTKSKRMGLGLYFARQVAEAHRGSIKVESSGKGTSVRIILPKV